MVDASESLVVLGTAVGEEGFNEPVTTPVHTAPIGQQAILSSSSREQIVSLLQQASA